MAMTAKGLAKLLEELGELSQVAGKKLAYFHTDEHPDGAGSLKGRLEQEMGDVIGAICFVADTMSLDVEAIARRRDEKLNRFHQWHADSSNGGDSFESTGQGAAPAPVAQGEPVAVKHCEAVREAGRAADASVRYYNEMMGAAPAPVAQPADMREAFETWVKEYSTLPVDRYPDNSYVDFTTELMRHAWQAAQKAAQKANALGGALVGESDAKAGPDLAGADFTCAHDFAAQPSSGIKLCAHCGLSEVAARKPAAPAPVAQPLTTAQKHAILIEWGDRKGTRTLFELIEMVERAHGIEATGQEGGGNG